MSCPEKKRRETVERTYSSVFISAQHIQGKETQLKMSVNFQVGSLVAKKPSSIASC